MRANLCVIVLLVSACAAPFAHAIVIDDFKVGPIQMVRNAGVAVSQSQTGLDPAHVLGGKRELILGENYSNGQAMEINTTESRMTLSVVNPLDMAGLEITYGSRTSPLGVDLTAEGHDRFVFDFDVLPSCCNWFNVTSLSGSTLSVGRVDLEDYYDGRVATIPFSEFSNVDFTNIASLELDFARHRGFVLQSIYTIPEPTTVWLLVMTAITAPTLPRRRWR